MPPSSACIWDLFSFNISTFYKFLIIDHATVVSVTLLYEGVAVFMSWVPLFCKNEQPLTAVNIILLVILRFIHNFHSINS